MSTIGGLTVVAIGIALAAAGLAAWSGSWNFWATPGIPSYGVLPLLLLPAGVMCLSAGIVASLGDLAENGLVALALLPLLIGFFGGALITIPGFFLLTFWSPKRIPDRLRPRWLPPTWTPPENTFSTISRPFIRRELRDRRPPGLHWPAVLVKDTADSTKPPPRYGFLALEDAALTWFDCSWDTPECKESFTVSAGARTKVEISEHSSRHFLQSPVTLSVTTSSSRLRFAVFTGVPGPRANIRAAIEAATS